MDKSATRATQRCPVCDSPIEQRALGRPRIYCSDGCKQDAHEERNGLSFKLERDLARKAERRRRTTYTSKEVLREFCRANPSYCVEIVAADPMLCAKVLGYLSALIRDLQYPTEDSGWAACYQGLLELRSSVDFITGAIPIGPAPTTPRYNRGDSYDEPR